MSADQNARSQEDPDTRPVGWQSPLRLELSRRGFLAGVGGSALTIDAVLASSDKLVTVDLRIDVSDDAKTLAVREVPKTVPKPPPGSTSKGASKPEPKAAPEPRPPELSPCPEWCVHAAAFGPKAWFELFVVEKQDKSTEDEHKRLRVRDATFGGGAPVIVDILFFPQTSLHGQTRLVDFWQIGLETRLWRNANSSAPWRSSRLQFSKFLHGADSYAPVNAAHAKTQLAAMFDGRVTTFEKGGDALEVRFRSDCLWQLTRTKGAAAAGFDNRVTTGQFTLGWYGFEQGTPFFRGLARDQNQISLDLKYFRVGGPAGASIELSGFEKLLGWEVRRVRSPLVPREFQSFSKLTFGGASLTVFNSGSTTVERVSVASIFLSETLLAGTKLVRQVLWGTAGAAVKLDENDKEPAYELRTLIGRLFVDAPPVTETQPVAKDTAKSKTARSAPLAAAAPFAAPPPVPQACAPGPCLQTPTAGGSKTARSADARAETQNPDIIVAVGDRNGARAASIWAVFDRNAEAAQFVARRIAIDLTLRGSDLALPDVSHSALRFDSTDLRLIYEDGKPLAELLAGEFPRARASSFVWIAPLPDGKEMIAQFDLSRASLTVARDVDLVKLRFRFLDMNLVLAPDPVIRPTHEDCRVIESNGVLRDDRPILVAEFDPQHVFEEVVFKQIPQLPDVALVGDDKQRGKILEKLASFDPGNSDSLKKLLDYRESIRSEKGTKSPTFEAFSQAYRLRARTAGVSEPQQIYIGPFALDPDAMALGRQVDAATLGAAVADAVNAMFGRVGEFIRLDQASKTPVLAPVLGNVSSVAFRNAFGNEKILEQQEPLYGLFRDFYRGEMQAAATPKGGTTPTFPPPSPQLDPREIEYLANVNRPKEDSGPQQDRLKRDSAIRQEFIAKIVDAAPIDGMMEARLSGRTRLAFHVNCQPAPGATAEEARLDISSRAWPERPADGGFHYPPMPFTFAALTDWSRHEPAVTLRARKLFTANPNGILPPIGDRAPNLTDADILAFQGLTRGEVTAEQRLGEIRTSLARKPTAFETAIELPARLTLSTAQDAIWLTERRLPPGVGASSCGSVSEAKASSPLAPAGETVLAPGQSEHSRKPLWTARLWLDGGQPDLRIVDSPDLRPLALTLIPYEARKPGQGAPPRGPLAPWFIGQEQMDAQTLTAASVQGTAEDEACKQPIVWRILRMLCARDTARAGLSDWRLFRAALDAYDRHELVLLSSAYGLPVIGKREAQLAKDTGGALAKDSGQVEPGDDFPILEADDGQAIQRPQPLQVSELWLSALGGSLVHDTRFSPSAGLADVWGKEQVFDGFSIERWRAEIVLGRDIVGEVVYKGYLFPFGHRASLIKLTERLFLLTKNQGVKAILVQRIFMRVGRKSQAYPSVGQPFEGRLWCSQDVTVHTTQTPDLRDPYEQPAPNKVESPQGRIFLDKAPGLAFWPRVNETDEGLVKFDLSIDGAVVSTPLIFVDNTAATNAASLGALVNHYRTAPEWIGRRTLALGLQKVRYAPEWKSGDCSLKTETILLDVSGRLASLGADWAGNLGEYHTTPVLEGAEQPPFYPAMDFASVRLEQVERFSGGKPTPVQVQYDGHYVRNGFANRSDEKPKNPMEIFLDLRNCVSMTMGDNGDRSGAVGRPDSDIVAFGRRNGPMGASGTLIYETDAAEKPTIFSLPLPAKPTTGYELIKLPAGAPLLPDFETLWSLADFFDDQQDKFARPSQPAPANGGPPSELVVGKKASEPAGEILKILQSFFSGSAKVLGVVSIRDLLCFLDLGDFFNSTPILRQTLQFASGALEEGESLIDDIHARILAPLRAAVDKLNAQWTALDQRLKEQLGPQPTMGLSDVFPEIPTGLKDLSAKLAVAQAESDPLQLTSDLADVYESGRAFVAALARLAANPLARLKEAAIADIQRVLHQFAQTLDVFDSPLALLKGLLDDLFNDATTVSDWINAQLGSSGQTDLGQILTLALAPPDLVALIQQTGQAIDRDLSDINDQLKKDLRVKTGDFVKALVKGAFDGNADAAVKLFVNGVSGQVNTAVGQAKAAIVTKLQIAKPEAVYIVSEELQAFADSVAGDVVNSPAFQNVVRAARIVDEIFQDIGRLKADIGVTPPKIQDALVQLDAMTGLVFGVGAGPFGQINNSLSAAFLTLATAAQDALIPILPAWPQQLSAELLACTKYQNGTTPQLVLPAQTSSDLTTTLAAAIAAVNGAIGNVARVETALQQNQAAIGSDYNDIKTFADATGDFLSKTGSPSLLVHLSTLYCEAVKTMSRLNAMSDFIGRSTADPSKEEELAEFADRLAQYLRAITDSTDAMGKAVGAAVHLAIKFAADNKTMIEKAGLLLGGAAALAALKVPAAFNQLQNDLKTNESAIVAQFIPAIDFSIDLITITKKFVQDPGLTKLNGALDTAKDALDSVGVDLNPELGKLRKAINDASENLTTLDNYQHIKGTPTSFAALIDSSVTKNDTVKIKNLFDSLGGDYRKLNRDLLNLEGAAIAEWRALRVRMKGLPWAVGGMLLKYVQAPLFRLAGAYNDLRESRDEVAAQVINPLFSSRTQRALFAPAVFYSTFDVDAPGDSLDQLENNDRLWEEVRVLNEFAAYALNATGPDPKLDKFVRFVASWTGNNKDQSASMQIAERVKDLAADVLKGQILALIDVAALRDAIEDALAQLIPTRAVFSYDFSRTVVTEPDESAIFQAHLGAQFSLSMRLTVDLLQGQRSDFQVTGSMGAFDIKLVGDFIDALTLSFGGASFQTRGDAKPHFDVSYVGYEIGEALEFAKEIQDYLTPSDGTGVHIGPLGRTLGLEAGYGISLGSIGVGEVSFFNIILDVSAELPFTESEALFKTSLGTRLNPFTISILPFAGSGYFAVYSAADGIRGFEASFLFGGGGSLQFGPLAAQVQIQVGTFIRVLKVDGVNSTEIYGTFLAAGSASIWIFHFAATLYVSLGEDSNGSMHGEATFTFSFSCGFVHYNYSITASHNQPALGKKSSGQSFIHDAPSVQFAALGDRSTMSDAAPIGFGPAYAAAFPSGVKTRGKSGAKGSAAAQAEVQLDNVADVTSNAICQSEDWKVFSSYFDGELLRGL